MTSPPHKTLSQVFKDDGRYSIQAVQFVREGYSYTVSKLGAESSSSRTERHVSGEQLCHGLRQLALQRWGLMAGSVLAHWNIRATRDFGEIVFIMVNSSHMKKQPSDQLDDFDDVFDFDEAFDRSFQITFDD